MSLADQPRSDRSDKSGVASYVDFPGHFDEHLQFAVAVEEPIFAAVYIETN